MLRETLKVMLDIQELDVQMIRLMRLKRERVAELARIRELRDELHHQVLIKESEVIELKKQIRIVESEITELSEKIEKLEAQQSNVRKVEEFNALTHEISSLERTKAAKEQRLSDSYDTLASEEDFLTNLKSTFEDTRTNSQQLEQEIKDSILEINKEGEQLMQQRLNIVDQADEQILALYEKLIQNKKDRVIVPIENRCCSGCHILITAQHENVVRRGERLVFSNTALVFIIGMSH